VAQGGAVPPQSFGILNTRQGVMNSSVSASVLGVGPNWLAATPTSGSSDAASLKVPLVDVAVKLAGLAAGEYYGQVRVTSSTADNSPQLVSVVLKVLPPGSKPPPVVRPTGLIFTSVAGTSPPSSQDVLVSNLTSDVLAFRSGRLTLDGLDWFMVVPPAESVSPAQPTRLVVQTDTTILTPNIRRGVLTLLFDDGNVQTVNLLSVLLGSGGTKGGSSADGCTPGQLLPILTGLPQNFSVVAGWPQRIDVRIVDDCGDPMVRGSVVASFSNGDPPISLAPLGTGDWSGTWYPRNSAGSSTIVTVTAEIPEPKIRAIVQVSGGLQATPNVPVVSQGALVNAASYSPVALVSPGSILAIFGDRLATTLVQASTVPLPTELGGVSVILGGQVLPLLFVSEHQVNAFVPFNATLNAQLPLVVSRGTSYSVPEMLIVAEAQPAIFTTDASGKGQGVIVNGTAVADATNPVRPGDVVVIYATGLGGVSPSVASGAASPVDPLARVVAPVEVRIDGKLARVDFSGLTPFFVGLYQVNAQVPAGISAGATVPVVVTVNGVNSNPAMIVTK